MITLPQLQKLKLSARPRVQRFIAATFLNTNYRWLGRVDIHLQGLSNLPDGPCILAMNHTDRYNYWPFQYALWRQGLGFTATWVKGKYYRNAGLAAFMQATNNLPTVSRGYLLAEDFLACVGRKASADEYATLRRALDRLWQGETLDAAEGLRSCAPEVVRALCTSRDLFGTGADPAQLGYEEAMLQAFERLMREFVRLNREAVDLGLRLIVFPEGTRSLTLGPFHGGLFQLALKLGLPIVPVGCSGSDRLYPGASPWARSGRVEYRIGKAIDVDAIDARIPLEDFEPFTRQSEGKWKRLVESPRNELRLAVEALIDPAYRSAAATPGAMPVKEDRFL